MSRRGWWHSGVVAASAAGLGAGAALAQSIPLSPTAQASGAAITVDQGIEFVTIGAAGNAAWPGDGTLNDRAVGRGAVGYEYRIGRFEVSTAQWVEFFNAAFDRPPSEWLPQLIPPDVGWRAAQTVPNTPGGLRWTTSPATAMLPVTQIDWRMSAMYCNWLHHDKSSDRSAFLSGAYDVSTFGYIGDLFTDQAARSPGARYFIPTWDEWIKAAHYDPNRFGPGQGGYWLYSNATNTPLVGGPPPAFGGSGQANFGWTSSTHPGLSPYFVPLGAYPGTQTPWGLLDMAGGTSEWTESILSIDGDTLRFRIIDGSMRDSPQFFGNRDAIYSRAGEFPSISSIDYGFRIAAVPSPSAGAILMLGVASLMRRRREIAR